MKITVHATKPRNPLVAQVRFRRSGSHRQSARAAAAGRAFAGARTGTYDPKSGSYPVAGSQGGGLNGERVDAIRNVPIDDNAAENSVRPLASGRRNWLFVGSQQAGERAGIVPSLIESVKLNDHDPWTCLKDVFERLPALKHRDLAQLLPHNWRPAADAALSAPVTAPEPLAA